MSVNLMLSSVITGQSGREKSKTIPVTQDDRKPKKKKEKKKT